MELTEEEEKQARLAALKELLSEDGNDDEEMPHPDDKKDKNVKGEAKEEEDKESDSDEKDEKNESYQAHLTAMFEGTELSEEAKEKLTVLFEAAVSFETDKAVSEIKAQLEEEKELALEAAEAEMREEADAYLSYVVEEWTEQNAIALNNQIKLDIMESFIGGLSELFLEHNINVPDTEVNLAEELMEKVSELEEDVKALSKKNVQVSEELDAAKREIEFAKVSEGMSKLDIEKLKTLAEGKEFDNAEEFAKGVALIKEAYFKKGEVSEDEHTEVIGEGQTEEVSAEVASYVQAIAKSIKK